MSNDPIRSEKQSARSAHWGKRNTAGVSFASSLLFDDISHSYGNGSVLDGVTIAVEPGEVLCLLGPSGSGKTTLLRIAAGIEAPAAGSVWIDKRVVAGMGVYVPPEKRGVGLVFQDFALFPHLTILQNVLFGLNAVPAKIARDEARRMLARVGLDSMGDLYPHQISGGEQQRAALARALAPRPGILLMDEPFSGLDSRLRDSVRDETIGLLRDTRSTAVIVTHDPEEALLVGDHIALMRDGRLIQHGTGRDLYDNPVDLFAAQFFSPLNLFEGRVDSGQLATPLGKVLVPGLSEGARMVCCLRPQDIMLAAHEKRRGSPAREYIEGRVLNRRFAGIAEVLEIGIAGIEEPLRARIRAGSLEPGANLVRVGFDEKAVLVFPAG